MAKKKTRMVEVLVNLTDKDGAGVIAPGVYPLTKLAYRDEANLKTLADKGQIIIEESEDIADG